MMDIFATVMMIMVPVGAGMIVGYYLYRLTH